MNLQSKISPTSVHNHEQATLNDLMANCRLSETDRQIISQRAAQLIAQIRAESKPSLMELFLSEYGLSSDEGVALMCLAEALLRVPDHETMDALIEDKIVPGAWGQHLGQSHSSLINASTWALFLTGQILEDRSDIKIAHILKNAIKRLGEPAIRSATLRAMEQMGHQFVLGETIEKAMARAANEEAKGYLYSYDMLGEAALTMQDAKRYLLAYSAAIQSISSRAIHDDIRDNPGISIKLSALHPRYETLQKERVIKELVPVVHDLAHQAKIAKIGLNIDAEEAGRLDLSLDVIEAVLSDPIYKGWDGFGIVVQAYNRRATDVIDRLHDLAVRLDRNIMIRLVKGAYWDSEIKHAQVDGHPNYPVFTQKAATDVSYLCCAEKLLSLTDRIYPQFATHNAHSVAAILHMAHDKAAFEFQRLHGMGEALHEMVKFKEGTPCRIYAPVGEHQDLLAYLVRRLLENGANSSFVNQLCDETVAPQIIAADPFLQIETTQTPSIPLPGALFAPERNNSPGHDVSDPIILDALETGIAAFDRHEWHYSPLSGERIQVKNPANGELVGSYHCAIGQEAAAIIDAIRPWDDINAQARADILNQVADLYLANSHQFYALLMREAGKVLTDCVGELREAVDFLRYYAMEAVKRPTEPAGIFTCISPWNFPLAIFTGQIAAALSVGNGVVAKPAESTSLIAHFAVELLYRGGVPKDVLSLVPGLGHEIGPVVTSHPKISGVCFTGSTQTAQMINRTMAEHLDPSAVLIAETGGLNAMIVDSTALLEQAVTDIVASAFQSAGQRCSALRFLYVQDDIKDQLIEMLLGAIAELKIGNPRDFTTDIGPIINARAAAKISDYINEAKKRGQYVSAQNLSEQPHFIAPTILMVDGIEDLDDEIFGPVLHVASFKNTDLSNVIQSINKKGYGLTFGLHSRIDAHVAKVIDHIHVGNIYINRNQIGAVVGSQPFGGQGLSGTGPKAGGPCYLDRFARIKMDAVSDPNQFVEPNVSVDAIHAAFEALATPQTPAYIKTDLTGPTGESNQYWQVPQGRILCLGPTPELAMQQAHEAGALGCTALAVTSGVSDGHDGICGRISPQTLRDIDGLDAVIYWGDQPNGFRQALAARKGPIIPLITSRDLEKWLLLERVSSIDTTASGGNIALLSQ